MPKNDNLLFVGEIIKTVLLIVLFVFVIRNFVVQPFYVVGSSMEPTYQNNDYLIIDELTYHILAPKRGQVVVLKHPTSECDSFVKQGYTSKIGKTDPCKNYIKRIIGLPGETVNIRNGEVSVRTNGNDDFITLNEKYIEPNTPTLGSIEKKLAGDEYFVIGDNREPNASSDSREWGALTRDHIIGKVWVRLLPGFELIKSPVYNKA
ncbi:MAG: Signal peptidase I [candidate division CPR2 bacterium GW2011_GWC1_41_48]|uniref:Signal peptidase I n=1 Tax=candidate division CPR2 bacterium GW2011_GWC1_41_48 TaxID=1618344 RepID=A0A0G0W9Q9_UNCC2|nr:MAG: Signal peptidase I [candidate division CPR2 bacterium GW2011_GWC2_39_35]KKS09690.1 MAG: Signal peptidase I [candidate division CPR2 bacterium GW2011_GWC1_41_48]